MKVLIDAGHPAHIHYFKNLAHELIKEGNSVLFTCREREFEKELLKANGFEFISLGKHFSSLAGKIFGLIKFDLQLTKIALKFKPDIFVSSGSMYAAHASFILRKPHITFEDTGNMEQIRLYKPFTKMIFTPNALPQKFGKKQIRYEGFHQSFYLHPNYFKKKIDFREKFDIAKNESIFLLRLVSLNATHDLKLDNIGDEDLEWLINFLDNNGHLFISSEKPLKKNLERFKLKINPHEIHDFIACCDLVVGESGAMTNEAAYLGIPNILVGYPGIKVHEKFSKLGLKYHFNKMDEKVINHIKEMVDNLDSEKKKFRENSQKYIQNSVNLTQYTLNVVKSLIS